MQMRRTDLDVELETDLVSLDDRHFAGKPSGKGMKYFDFTVDPDVKRASAWSHLRT